MKKFGPKFFAMGAALAVTFLFSSVPKVYPQDDPLPGTYVGILSFDNGVKDLIGGSHFFRLDPEFIALDPEFIVKNRETGDPILTALNNYADSRTTDDNAALFYAAHKAMADLKKAEADSVFPSEVDLVYLVTITDSYDSASAPNIRGNNTWTDFHQTLRPTPINTRNEDEYSVFINKKLRETTIKGKQIEAFSLGLRPAWPNQLEFIATGREYVKYGSLDDLIKNLGGITDEINSVNDKMTLTAVFTPPFDGTRFRFKINESNYIDGTVISIQDECYLTDIKSVPESLYEPDSYIKKSIREGNAVSFDFTVNGVFRDGQPGTVSRITPTGMPVAVENTQLYVHKKSILERKSIVVYFLLDNSKSMENMKIVIRDALIQNINSLKVGTNNP
ncbi:hypothetical protein AGMMS49579_15870 [Spirochaetia bacterium]|nr:hypothetical protein AGMMS49579_15870 [Spirochaetia bacterium]